MGQPVALTFANCGRCASNDPSYCERSTDLNMRGDGGDEASAFSRDRSPIAGGLFGQSSFATYAIARQDNTVALTEAIDPALAAPLGCSVQTGIGTVLNVLAPQRNDAVVTRGPMPKPRVSQTTVFGAQRPLLRTHHDRASAG